jgi:hypothetical protein
VFKAYLLKALGLSLRHPAHRAKKIEATSLANVAEYAWDATRNPNASICAVTQVARAGPFWGFSYGFRPGRSQHQALDALYVVMPARFARSGSILV